MLLVSQLTYIHDSPAQKKPITLFVNTYAQSSLYHYHACVWISLFKQPCDKVVKSRPFSSFARELTYKFQ